MRIHAVFAALLISAALIVPAGAATTPQQTAMKTCAANWNAMSAADKAKTKHTDYMSSCLKGGASSMAMTAKPAAGGSMTMAAPGGHAKCKDGTTVAYKSRQGTCSGHGGVASWM